MQRSKQTVVFLVVCGAFAVASHAQGGASPQSKTGTSDQASPSGGTPQGQGMMPCMDGMHSMRGMKPNAQQVTQFIQGWPAESRSAAQQVMEKYGVPDEVASSELIWHNAGQFKHTLVHRDAVEHNFPYPHRAVLEQVIAYRIPVDRYDDVARFDGSVVIDRTKGEISARHDSEAMNILALNLTDQIASGQRSVQNAREFFGRVASDMQKASKERGATALVPREASLLLVDLTREDTADRDVAVRGGTSGAGGPVPGSDAGGVR